MPIYEYQCSVCGTHFEMQQKMQDSPPQKAPGCTRKDCQIDKQLSAFAAVVKSANPIAASVARLGDAFPHCQKPAPKEQSTHICSSGCAMHSL